MNVTNYRDLLVWQKAMDLALQAYEITERFPKQETFGLSIQLRRATVNVATNIAEGSGREQTREFINSLGLAKGSLLEAETLFILANRLQFLPDRQLEQLLAMTTEMTKMIYGLMRSLGRKLAED